MRAREGALIELMERERGRVVALAYHLVGDAAAAEDIAQDSFVRAWSGLGRYRGEAQVRTWLTRIVINTARSHRRWRGIRARLGLLVAAPAGDHAEPQAAAGTWSDPESQTTAAELRGRIAAAMDHLSHGQREVFVLVHLGGHSLGETATLLAKAPGTVKSHLHRALVTLRAQLGDLMPDETTAERRHSPSKEQP